LDFERKGQGFQKIISHACVSSQTIVGSLKTSIYCMFDDSKLDSKTLMNLKENLKWE
jgi:hypothetical protein